MGTSILSLMRVAENEKKKEINDEKSWVCRRDDDDGEGE